MELACISQCSNGALGTISKDLRGWPFRLKNGCLVPLCVGRDAPHHEVTSRPWSPVQPRARLLHLEKRKAGSTSFGMKIFLDSGGDKIKSRSQYWSFYSLFSSTYSRIANIIMLRNIIHHLVQRINIIKAWGFPGGSKGKASACKVGDPGLIPGSGRFPGKERQPTPVFLPGKSHGRRNLIGIVHGVSKSQTQLSDFTFTF